MNRRKFRKACVLASLAATLLGVIFPISGPSSTLTAVASTGVAPLQPSSGQYVPITSVKAMDTRYGIGGVPIGRVSSSGTITFEVLGIGQVPATGVSAVMLNVSAISPSGSGYLSAYSDDVSDSGLSLFNWNDGVNSNGADVIAPGADGGVTISVHSYTSTQVSASVRGYFLDGSQQSAGDTYVPMNWVNALDTRSGLNTNGQLGPISSGAKLSLQVTDKFGIPAQNIDAVAVEIGAIGGSTSGFLVDGPSGGSISVPSVVSYGAGQIDRTPDFVQVDPISGAIQVANEGSGSVGLQITIRGYFINSIDPNSGSTATPITAAPIYDTRNIGLPIAPNTFRTISMDTFVGAPNAPMAAVMDTFNVISPTANGYLSIYPSSSADPNLSSLNFYSNDNAVGVFDSTVMSSLSGSQQVNVFNHSSGWIDLSVVARGYWMNPTVPNAPSDVSVQYATGYGVANWTTPWDGGMAISGYEVTDSNTGFDTITSGTTNSITIPGAAHGDAIAVSASNTIGSSSQSLADDVTPPPIVLQGTILTAQGLPAQASLTLTAEPAAASGTLEQIPLAFGTTGSDGTYSLDATPPSNISEIESIDGTFDVVLSVTSGNTVQLFTQTMTVSNGLLTPAARGGHLLHRPVWQPIDSSVLTRIVLKGGRVSPAGKISTSHQILSAKRPGQLSPKVGMPASSCIYQSTVQMNDARTYIANTVIAKNATHWTATFGYTNTKTTQFDSGFSFQGTSSPLSLTYAGTSTHTSSAAVTGSLQFSGQVGIATNRKTYITSQFYRDNYRCWLPSWGTPPASWTTWPQAFLVRVGAWDRDFASLNNDSAGAGVCPVSNTGFAVGAGGTVSRTLGTQYTQSNSFSVSFTDSLLTYNLTGNATWTDSKSGSVNSYQSWHNNSSLTKHLCAISRADTNLASWGPKTHGGVIVAEQW